MMKYKPKTLTKSLIDDGLQVFSYISRKDLDDPSIEILDMATSHSYDTIKKYLINCTNGDASSLIEKEQRTQKYVLSYFHKAKQLYFKQFSEDGSLDKVYNFLLKGIANYEDFNIRTKNYQCKSCYNCYYKKDLIVDENLVAQCPHCYNHKNSLLSLIVETIKDKKNESVIS